MNGTSSNAADAAALASASVDRLRGGWRRSVVLRVLIIGFLVLGLLIPLAMVLDLVRERQGRQGEAEAQVAAAWGRPQEILAPVLVLPVEVSWRTDKGTVTTRRGQSLILPANLEVEGRLEPEIRHLGIFEVVVFKAHLRISGSFASDSGGSGISGREDVVPLWNEAFLALGLAELRGIGAASTLAWNGQPLALEPGTGEGNLLGSGARVRLPGLSGQEVGKLGDFAVDLTLNGSRELRIVPVGRSTRIHLSSPWPDPSFVGASLPAERTVSAQGFDATWNLSQLEHGLAGAWSSERFKPEELRAQFRSAAVGVELLKLVDGYRKTERSAKYAILFILVTFTTFFLFEIFQPFVLHPLNYLLVGFALCVFYLLVLSLSEMLPFGLAYGLAALATVVLIAGYSASVLRGRRRGLVMGAVLGGLYGYLYVLLQLSDYALLLGALGLFAALATVMMLTRRVDWNGLELGKSSAALAS